MGHKENGGIGITGLKMGLACCFSLPYDFHIRHFLQIICPSPFILSLCRICYYSLKKNAATTVAKKKIANFREMVREYFV